MAKEEKDINYMHRKLVNELNKWGLETDVDKTKFTVIRESEQYPEINR